MRLPGWLGSTQDTFAKEIKIGASIHASFDQFEPIDVPLHWTLGTNLQLHLMTRMVNRALSSLTPFILFVVKPFLCWRNALRGREERVFFLDPESQQIRSLPLT